MAPKAPKNRQERRALPTLATREERASRAWGILMGSMFLYIQAQSWASMAASVFTLFRSMRTPGTVAPSVNKALVASERSVSAAEKRLAKAKAKQAVVSDKVAKAKAKSGAGSTSSSSSASSSKPTGPTPSMSSSPATTGNSSASASSEPSTLNASHVQFTGIGGTTAPASSVPSGTPIGPVNHPLLIGIEQLQAMGLSRDPATMQQQIALWAQQHAMGYPGMMPAEPGAAPAVQHYAMNAGEYMCPNCGHIVNTDMSGWSSCIHCGWTDLSAEGEHPDIELDEDGL
jgi:hypothetical protein